MSYTALTYGMNAVDAVAVINANAGNAIVSVSMNAEQFVAALNAHFNGHDGVVPLTTEMNAVSFIDTINANFAAMDVPIVPAKTTYKFLHLSDSHGFAAGLEQAKAVLDGDDTIDALLFTGDYTGHAIYNNAAIYAGLTYNGTVMTSTTRQTAITTSEVNAAFNSIKSAHVGKLLMLAGNHDAYDNANGYGYQQTATNAIKGWMTDGAVTWGDTGGKASYWVKDITLSATSKLRIIALDQYENSYLGKRGTFSYWPLYTQAQMDWLVARLKELTANDYLLMAVHEPVYQDDSVIADLLSDVTTNGKKLFLSERFSKFNYKGATASMNLIPRIMRSYLDGVSSVETYENLDKGSAGTSTNTTISVNASFAGNSPARFIGYFGGHRHCDIAIPLPAPYADQRMVHIAAADWVVASSSDNDLLAQAQENYQSSYNASDRNVKVSGNADYCINEVTLDFAQGTMRIDRIGASNTRGGRVRNTITFNI